MEKNIIKKITVNELLNLQNWRSKLYDELLDNANCKITNVIVQQKSYDNLVETIIWKKYLQ